MIHDACIYNKNQDKCQINNNLLAMPRAIILWKASGHFFFEKFKKIDVFVIHHHLKPTLHNDFKNHHHFLVWDGQSCLEAGSRVKPLG